MVRHCHELILYHPGGWQAIVDAADMRQTNRDAIAACENAAAKTKGSTRDVVLERRVMG